MLGLKRLLVGLLRWMASAFTTYPIDRISPRSSAPPITICGLEARRVLSVSATFVSGVLDIVIQNDGDNTDASLLAVGTDDFFVDANGDQTYDDGTHGPAELRGLMADLTQVNVTGDAGQGGFFWRDNFAAAMLKATAGDTVHITQVNTASIAASVMIDGDVDISARQQVEFGGSIDITGNLTAATLSPPGLITNSADANLNVDGNAGFQSHDIRLGNQPDDQLTFGSVTINSTGTAEVEEDSSTVNDGSVIVGSNSVDMLTLRSAGDIDVTASSVIGAGTIRLLAEDGGRLSLDSTIVALNGDVDLQAASDIDLGSQAKILSGGSANVSLLAQGGSVDMLDGSLIEIKLGSIHVTAEGGDATLSQLTTSSLSDTAIEVRAAGDILDGTSLEAANAEAPLGTIRFTSLSGGIGTASDDININAAVLSFHADSPTSGIANVTDNAGGLRLGLSSTGAGATVVAHSPLTISANISVGASSTFVAGNSPSSGDRLTIDNSAVVSLTAMADSELIFQAGDDIVFNSGSVVTGGGGVHTVQLLADLDNSGVGSGDGDRGRIDQDGLATVEVTTDKLFASGAEKIDLDTEVAELTATSSLSGEILIHEVDDILIQSLSTANGSIDLDAGGFVLGFNFTASGAARMCACGPWLAVWHSTWLAQSSLKMMCSSTRSAATFF